MKKILSLLAGLVLFANASIAEELSIEKQLVGIVGAINGTVKTETRTLKAGDKIYLNETIYASENSGTQILLLDQSTFTIGSESEVVMDAFIYDPENISYESLLTTFWEDHDPTQGMRQGNDIGTQYRSGIYYADEEEKLIIDETKAKYQKKLDAHGIGKITTEIKEAGNFYYAEHYHQQYLAKNPDGYCALAGTGIKID